MTLTADRPTGIDFAAARRSMIDSQLRVSGVTADSVIAAMSATAREDHVPAAARSHAYIDRAIALDNGQSLPAPLVQGRMLAEAAPTTADAALLVSCGSGYMEALLAPLVGSLAVLSPAEAATKKGKGGYSLVIVEGAIEHLPASLAAQLGEGGRIVTGLVERGVTRLAIGRQAGGSVSFLTLADLGMPVLGEFAAPQRWSF